MRKTCLSASLLLLGSLMANSALACGGEGHGPMGKAELKTENTTDGVKVTVSVKGANEVKAIQEHLAQLKERRDKGLDCGCKKGEGPCQGDCKCSHAGKEKKPCAGHENQQGSHQGHGCKLKWLSLCEFEDAVMDVENTPEGSVVTVSIADEIRVKALQERFAALSLERAKKGGCQHGRDANR